jgi:hypothetical protein
LNILHFEMNVPKEVALQSTQGTLVQGRYGDRVMFQLAEGGVMYVPPIVATKIEEQSIAAGERFELCKSRVAVGRRCSIDWRVRRKEPQESPPESQLESDLRESIEAVASNRLQLVPMNANGTAPAVNGSAKSAQNGGGTSTPTTKLEHALKTAITAACNAEKYGAALGYVVRFDSDAIKSMAITVLINMSEGSRR